MMNNLFLDLSKHEKLTLKDQIQKELTRRSFWNYCQYMNPTFFKDTRPHLIKIVSAFQRIIDGEIVKLMISVPPRAGKSYTTSQLCAYQLGIDPESLIMRNTYGASLAWELSACVRDIINSERYQALFPWVKIRKDRSKIDSWQFYTGTQRSRMEDNCAEILIGTRWSTGDVHAKLLDLEPEEWEKIIIPALDKNGRSYCEEITPTNKYYQIEKLLLKRKHGIFFNSMSVIQSLRTYTI